MPPIYYLNPPPHPFWDFVANMEDHPLFRGNSANPQAGAPEPAAAAPEPQQSNQPGMSDNARGKQPEAEDPPEVDPATVKPTEQSRDIPFRGRGGHGGRGRSIDPFDGQERCRRGRDEHGRHGRRWGGPRDVPPFPFGGPWGGPFWARPGPPGPHPPAGPGSDGEHPRGPSPPHRGRGGHFGPHGHRGHHGPHGHGPHGHGHHHRGPPGPPGGFDIGSFLNRLGDKLGIDLTGAAEGLGFDRFAGSRNNQDADFEPRSDIFENKDQYTIHVSLPGAKKEDVGVDYDGENSVLHIAGVVHRPGADEQMLKELVVDGRKRETGVFEKAVRLGTKNDPASIDVSGIHAKMADGVLIVKVPKVKKVHEKRDVPIAANTPPSYEDTEQMFDADQEMYDHVETEKHAPTFTEHTTNEKERDLLEPEADANHNITMTDNAPTEKAAEAAQEQEKHVAKDNEQLPDYRSETAQEESEWERYSDEEEGDFVKIDVQ